MKNNISFYYPDQIVQDARYIHLKKFIISDNEKEPSANYAHRWEGKQKKNQIIIRSIYVLTLYVKERACWTSESRKGQGSVVQILNTNNPSYRGTFKI
jgi:hypothetical protein